METQVNYDAEALKIQRWQMMLQVVSVVLSATLLYFLISGEKKVEEIAENWEG